MRSSLKFTTVLAIAVALSVLLAPIAVAQSRGTIQGQVRAENGDPIPGATVIIKGQDTGYIRTLIADDRGFYRGGSLESDTYTITAEMEGIGSAERRNIKLYVGQILDINPQFGVDPAAGDSTVSESIIVTDEAPLVEVSRSDVASYLSQKQIEELPVPGRDFKQFTLLQPAVQDDPSRGFVTISGQRGIYSGMRVDGSSSKNAFFGYANGGEATENDGLTIAQESVKEFQVIQNGFSPEFGLDGGGFVNVLTKNGTNQFHGSAFYFKTDDSLTEDSPSSPLDNFRGVDGSTPADTFDRDNYGLTIGGPIRRDKLHFFFSWDHADRNSPTRDDLRTPGAYDALMARGFDSLLIGYTPNNDGVAAPDAVNGRTASGIFDRNVSNDILFGRIDWSASQLHQVSLRYNYVDYERTSTFLDEESLKQEEVNTLQGSLVSVVNSRGVNDFRFQYNTDDLNRGNLRVGSDVEAQFRFQTSSRCMVNCVRVSDSVGKFDFLPIIADTQSLQIKDSFSYLFGEHDVKVGFDYSEDRMKQLFAGSADGRYDYTSLDDFLANTASAARFWYGSVEFPNYDETQKVFAIFAQDTWKPGNGRLTLNYGLRYGKTDNPGNLEHAFVEGREIPDDDHIAPRIGFAYQLVEGRTDVLRGGIGVFYGRTPTLLMASAVTANGLFPNYGQLTVSPGDPGFTQFGDPIQNLNPPADTAPQVTYFDPNFKDAKNTRLNIGYERQLGRNWAASIDGLYAEGDNLARNIDANAELQGLDSFGRPIYTGMVRDPRYNTLFLRTSDGESKYQAITLKANRRFAGIYSFQAHYTWSKDKDHDSNEREATDLTVSNFEDPDYDWGYSDRNVENRFVALGTVDLPLGFLIGGTFTWQDGSPWTAVDSNVLMPNCPTRVCPAPRAIIDGRLVGRNTFQNESITRLNLRASWGYELAEARLIEVFVEVFNLFNQNSFSVDNTFNLSNDPFDAENQQFPTINGVANPEFGIADNLVTNPRSIQLGARFRF